MIDSAWPPDSRFSSSIIQSVANWLSFQSSIVVDRSTVWSDGSMTTYRVSMKEWIMPTCAS